MSGPAFPSRGVPMSSAGTIYHVLTAYHLGGNTATLTIEPRPYEGENWELAGGPRIVEGIQEFVLIAQVPDTVGAIDVDACLTIGFLGKISTDGALLEDPQ